MDIQNDFKELLESFNARRVEYVVVGGHAVAFHGAPRYTGDIDLFVRCSPENADRIYAALCDFGFQPTNLAAQDFAIADRVIQLGVPPVRVDILTTIAGVDWDEVWIGRADGRYAGVPIHLIGREQLVRNKRAAGRKKDLADLEALGEEDDDNSGT